MVESFFSVHKKERIKRRTYPIWATAALHVFDYVEMLYPRSVDMVLMAACHR